MPYVFDDEPQNTGPQSSGGRFVFEDAPNAIDPRQAEVDAYEAQGGGMATGLERGLRRAGQSAAASVGTIADYLPYSPVGLALKAAGKDRDAIGQDILEQERAIQALPQHPTTARMMQAADEASGEGSIWEAIKGGDFNAVAEPVGAAADEFMASPDKLGFALDMTAEQLPVFANFALGAKGAGALTNTLAKSAPALARSSATMAGAGGFSSVAATYGPNMAEALQMGLEYDDAEARAMKQSAAQALVDGATSAVLPFKIGPGQYTNVPAQALLQAAGGGGGEIARNAAVGEEAGSGDVVIEAMLELLGLPVEAVQAAATKASNQPAPQPEPQPAPNAEDVVREATVPGGSIADAINQATGVRQPGDTQARQADVEAAVSEPAGVRVPAEGGERELSMGEFMAMQAGERAQPQTNTPPTPLEPQAQIGPGNDQAAPVDAQGMEGPIEPRKVDPVLTGENVVDEEATKAKLPPVPDGMTRVYRAYSPTVKFEDVFDVEKLKGYSPQDRKGDFYTTDLSYADYFRETYGRDAEMQYLDVPNEQLAQSQVNPGEYVIDTNVQQPDPSINAEQPPKLNDRRKVNQPVANDRRSGQDRRGFRRPFDVAVEEHYNKAREMGLSAEQAKAFEPQDTRDSVTGFQRAEDREPTLQRAQEHIKQTGQPGTYVEADIGNLGGMNNALGHAEADTVYRGITDRFEEELNNLGVDFVPVRHGGDEFSAIIVGADPQAVEPALARAKQRVREYIKEQGLSDIEHTKEEARKLGIRGVDVNFGTSEIIPDAPAKAIFSVADKQVEAKKLEVDSDVNGIETGETGTVAPEGQAGGAEESAPGDAGPTGAVPEEVEQGGELGRGAGEEGAVAGADEQKVANFQRKLYSTPFDPELLGDLFKDLAKPAGWTKKQWDEATARWREDIEITRDNMQGAFGHRPPWQQVGHVARVLGYSNDGMLEWAERHYDSPTIGKIRRMLWAPAGERDRATGVTWQDAVNRRTMTNLNKMAKLLGKVGRKEADLTQVARLMQNPENIRPGTPIHDAAKGLSEMLQEELAYQREAGVDVGEVKGYFPRMPDGIKIADNQGGFLKAAERAYQATYPELKAEEAKEMAERWQRKILMSDIGVQTQGNDFVSIHGSTPVPDHVKKRVFNKEAEAILQPWMQTNPTDALSTYFIRSARRAEWERRFGGEKWKELRQQMEEEGAWGAIDTVVKAIQSATGNTPGSFSGDTSSMLSWLRTWTALTFLPRATLSSLSEITMTAVRTGDARTLARNFVTTFRELKKSHKNDELRAISEEVLGLTGKVANDMLMQQRFGGQVDRKMAQYVTNRFFYMTGLHQWTEATRIASLDVGQWYMQRLANDVAQNTSRKKSSEAALTELGIADPAAFAKALDAAGGKLDAERMKARDQFAEEYATALQRFVDQTIMNPKASERPRYANTPVGSLAYALLSFIYSFHKNVLTRSAKMAKKGAFGEAPKNGRLGVVAEAGREAASGHLFKAAKTGAQSVIGVGYTPADRLAMASPALMLTLPVLVQLGLGELRDEVLFKDPNRKVQDRDITDKVIVALSRAGIFGAFDPLINFYTSLKYERDPATVALGPLMGTVSEMLKAFVVLNERNSENTDTAERNFGKHIYNLFVAPGLNMVSTLAPSPVAGAVGIQSASHPATRAAFMDLFGDDADSGRSAGRTSSRSSSRSTSRNSSR